MAFYRTQWTCSSSQDPTAQASYIHPLCLILLSFLPYTPLPLLESGSILSSSLSWESPSTHMPSVPTQLWLSLHQATPSRISSRREKVADFMVLLWCNESQASCPGILSSGDPSHPAPAQVTHSFPLTPAPPNSGLHNPKKQEGKVSSLTRDRRKPRQGHREAIYLSRDCQP